MPFTAHRLPDLTLSNGDVVFFNNGISYYKYAQNGAYITKEDPRFLDDERYIDHVVIRNNHGAELMVLTKKEKPVPVQWLTWIVSEMENADYVYRLADVEYKSLYRRFIRRQKTQAAMDLIMRPSVDVE